MTLEKTESLCLAEDAMLDAWRRYRDASALYAALVAGSGPDRGGPPSVEVALLVRRCAVELRKAIETFTAAAEDARSVAAPPIDGAG